MLCEPVMDRRAWRADTLAPEASWYYELPTDVARAARETVQQLRSQDRPLAELQPADFSIGACSPALSPIMHGLEETLGFSVIRGLPRDSSPQEQTALYWLLGQMLGKPVEQNVQGTILYDVRDTGQDVRYGARFSVTNAESSFHTDNSFGPRVLDYVGLLCLNPAKSGGRNQLISAYAVHNELLAEHPDVLRVLYEPFHVDRRGGVREGESPTIQFPIMHWDDRGLTIRYLRYWIEVGHEKAGQPLTDRQLHAIDVLDQILGRPALHAEFTLRAGDILIVNNRWLLHNRTAFEDHDEPARKRHLVRLWIESNTWRAD